MPSPKSPSPPSHPPASPGLWRVQINQNVSTPRTTAISQKRHNYAMLKIISSIFLVCLCVVGVYLLYTTWHDDPSDIKAPVRNQPLKTITLNNPGGVLDHAWVTRTLALPKGVDMMELNLSALRDRLLANPQIRTATLTRQFPDTLVITLEERRPVARLLVQRAPAIPPEELLVALDGTQGILYTGINYKPERLATLLYLANVPLIPTTPNATTYAPIDDMKFIADLITTAQGNIPNPYANWRSISLKRYAYPEDRVLIVNNADNSQIIFGIRENFRAQIARLDWIMDNLDASAPNHGPLRTIDLSLGQAQVPVTFWPATNGVTTSTTITVRRR